MFFGRPLELDTHENLLVMGRFIGRIHSAGAEASFLDRLEINVDRFAVQSREFLLSNDFIPPDLIAAYETLSQDLILGLRVAFLAMVRLRSSEFMVIVTPVMFCGKTTHRIL